MLNTLKSKITFYSTVIIIIAMISTVYIVYINSYKQFFSYAKSSISNETKLITNDISNALIKLEKDIELLSRTPPVSGIIRSIENRGTDQLEASTLEQWKKRLASIFKSMLNVNPNYTQIRYIGLSNNGKEIVRVNRSHGKIYTAHESALQEKGNRTYFKEGMKLSEGSIYFSRVNFNKEKGKITLPLEPTLRVITPIYTNKQELFGLLIINVNIENYLSDILLKSNIKYDVTISNKFNDTLFYDHAKKDLIFEPGNSQKPSPQTKNNNHIVISQDIFADKYKNHKLFTITLNIPKSRILLNERNFIADIIIGLMLITIISIFLVYVFSSRILMPLSRMTDSIRASTNTAHQPLILPTHLKDEVGLLAKAFEEKTQMLNKLASFDSLTGLPNRKKIIEHLDEAILRSKRNQKICACLYMDLNKFKQLNDTYGHDYGDILLIKFSNILKQITSNFGTCGRLGGDEFIVILEDINSIKELENILSRLENELNQTINIKGVTIHVKISGGVAIYPDDGEKSDELLKFSDEAMYQSKKDNQGKFYLYGKI